MTQEGQVYAGEYAADSGQDNIGESCFGDDSGWTI